MKKHSLKVLLLAAITAGTLIVAGCSKEEKPESNNPDTTSGATHEESDDLLVGTWQMDLDKSYSQITEYDDKKAADAVSGATSGGEGGDTPQGGVITYMGEVYASASMGFDGNGTATSTYSLLNSSSTTTTTSTYTRYCNTLTMDSKKYYIVEASESTLVLENYNIFMAKGKDVYCEFLHLVYHK